MNSERKLTLSEVREVFSAKPDAEISDVARGVRLGTRDTLASRGARRPTPELTAADWDAIKSAFKRR
jgi:hypothetical protein